MILRIEADPRGLLIVLLIGVLAGLLGYVHGRRERAAKGTPEDRDKGQRQTAPSADASPAARGGGGSRPTLAEQIATLTPRQREIACGVIERVLNEQDLAGALGREAARAQLDGVSEVVEEILDPVRLGYVLPAACPSCGGRGTSVAPFGTTPIGVVSCGTCSGTGVDRRPPPPGPTPTLCSRCRLPTWQQEGRAAHPVCRCRDGRQGAPPRLPHKPAKDLRS